MIPVLLHGRGDGVLWENQRNRAVHVLTRKVASKQVLCLSDEIEDVYKRQVILVSH